MSEYTNLYLINLQNNLYHHWKWAWFMSEVGETQGE